MASNFRYYLVIADNGGMIALSWEQAQQCFPYLWKHRRFKGYDNLEEVMDALYQHLDEIAPLECPIPAALPIGKIVTVKRLMATL